MKYQNKVSKTKNQKQGVKKSAHSGFTLIELLVVIAIIALLNSIALIAFMSARQKGRDAKRLSDMTQMNTGLNLYFSTYGGYPSSTTGRPDALTPSFAASLPTAPQPPDGSCPGIIYPSPPLPVSGITGASYYYMPSGTALIGTDGQTTVYPDYAYYFCLGAQTGNFGPGMHVLTSASLK